MPTAQERNKDILRKAYSAWHDSKAARTDMWTDIIADRFQLCSVTDSAVHGLDFCRIYNDRDQVADYFASILKDWDMVYYRIEDMIAEGDTVAVLCNICWRFKRTGKEAPVKKVDIWKFDADGHALRFVETFDTASVLAATQ
jgi:ketosteroid isomerase-like protein